MKIACITASAVPSSSANSIQAMKVCQALAQLGNEVTLLVPGTPLRLPPNEQHLSHGDASRGGETGNVIALIKPQFEAGRKESARGEGVIRDPEVHRRVLTEVLTFAQGEGLAVRGLIHSPLLGPKGNVEFLVWLDRAGSGEGAQDAGEWVDRALE